MTSLQEAGINATIITSVGIHWALCVNATISTSLVLKVESAILVKGCRYLGSTANQITSVLFKLLKQTVDWLKQSMTRSTLLYLFPRTMYEYHFFLEPYKMDSKKAVMSNLLNFAKK